MQAEVQGLDHEGRPSLDPVSSWKISASFTPASNTGFLKLRTADILQPSPENERHYLYIFIPPERIASLAVETGPTASTILLRLVFKHELDVIGPQYLASPGAATESDKQLLDHVRWLAARPALAITIFYSRIALDRWQQFCNACTDGSLQSDADHADLAQMYRRRGGHIMNRVYGTDTPPAYEDECGTLEAESHLSRKRQRADAVMTPEAMGKGFETYIRTICMQIVARQQDEMVAPLLARIKEMEHRITDNVMDNVEGLLERRLEEMREELQDGVDETLDSRVDALKEQINEYVIEEVKEQVEEQIGHVEEDLIETVMDRIA